MISMVTPERVDFLPRSGGSSSRAPETVIPLCRRSGIEGAGGSVTNGLSHLASDIARSALAARVTIASYDEKGRRGHLLHERYGHSPTSATGTGWDRTPARVCCSG